MKRFAVAVLLVIGVLLGAVAFLLNTATGLRWTLDQVLARTGAPVEIGDARGKLLGPISLSNVRYRSATDGARVRLDRLRIDWQPRDFAAGLLHITGLQISGIDYAPGQPGGGSRPVELPVPDIALPFRVQLDRLELDAVSIGTGSGNPVRIDRASLRARLDGRSLALSQVALSAPRYQITEGRVRIELAPGLPIDGSLSWRIEPDGMPVFTGALKADGAVGGTLNPSVDITEPFAVRGNGTVSGVLDSPQWTLSATVPDPVSLAAIRSDWPDLSINGTLQGQGDTGQARLQPDVSLAFRGLAGTLEGDAKLTPDGLDVAHARLARAGTPASVEFSGRLGLSEKIPFKVRGKWQSLHGPENAPWSSRSGEFEADGSRTELAASLSGVVTPPGNGSESNIKIDLAASHLDKEPAITGTADLPYFSWGDIEASGVNADVNYHPGGGDAPSRVVVKARTLRFGERHATDVEVQATGTPTRHEVTLDGRLDGWAIAAGVGGSYTDQGWQGQLQRFTTESASETLPGRWELERPADLAWTPSKYDVGELCLGHEGAKICAAGHFSAGTDWGLDVKVAGFPLKWLARDTADPLRIEGTVAVEANVGDQGRGIEGKAHASIDEATVAWEADEPITTHYRNFELNATLDPRRLHMQVQGSLDEGGTVRGDLTTVDPLAADGDIQGNIAAQLPSLQVVQAAFPALGLTKGSARLEFKIDGARSAPRFTGEGRIEQAVVDVASLGVQLKSLNLEVKSGTDQQLHIEAQATAGDGTVEARGDFGWPAGGAWQGQISVSGDHAQLARLPQAVIAGSPDLHVNLGPGGGTVKGSIHITHAELTPEATRPKVTISDDIVVVGGKEAAATATQNPMGWHAKVDIDLGDDTRFRGYGVTGKLSGSLSLDAPPRQPIRATGSVEIHDGEYDLYGRTFDIKKGRLVYTGGPVDNPGIEVRVGRAVGDVSVSLAVNGQLVNPDLQLTSTPAMSDTDKMSYLLLGRPASQASGAEAGLLLRAAASLIPHSGRGVSSEIQSTLGLDTLEVRTDSPENEGASVVLGKYLSPKLYVSYVAGFQQAVDEFRVRYDLTRHWLLRAESSSRESGGDLLFKW